MKTIGMITFSGLAVSAMVLTANAAPVPVDLSSWTAEGGGNWILEADDNGVRQSINGNPTVFSNGVASSQGTALSGTVEVQTTGDDDWFGFVLGYNVGDLDNAAADFLLVDWKQRDQDGYQQGLAISRVTGDIPNNDFSVNPPGRMTASSIF